MKKFLMGGILISMMSFTVSCSIVGERVEISGDRLMEKADLFLKDGKYKEAKILYEILIDDYEIDVDDKLNEASEGEKCDKEYIALDKVVDDYNYEEEKALVQSINSNDDIGEMNRVNIFRYTAKGFIYDEFTNNAINYLNSRVVTSGEVYEVLNSNESYMEFILREANSGNPVKVYAEYNDYSGSQWEVGDIVMVHGYYMGMENDNNIGSERVPSIKSIITGGLAG